DRDLAPVLGKADDCRVGMGAGGELAAAAAAAAGIAGHRLFAEEQPSQRVGDEALADAGRAGEQKRMHQPLPARDAAQELDLLAVPDDLGEAHRAESAAGRAGRIASTAARISSATRSGGASLETIVQVASSSARR